MLESRPRHGVVILAAGDSSRLGQPKQLLIHQGETLVRRAAHAALATMPHDAVIVLGAHADSVYSQVGNLPLRRADCANWQTGLSASLRAGIDGLSVDCVGALIVVCDQPALDAAHLEALCSTWREQPLLGAASFYADRLGVPALLPRIWFAEILSDGDRGARDLLASRRDRIRAVSNEALALDIDRPDDLKHLA